MASNKQRWVKILCIIGWILNIRPTSIWVKLRLDGDTWDETLAEDWQSVSVLFEGASWVPYTRCHTQEAIWPRDQEHRRDARSGVMSSAPVSTRRYQDSDSGSLNLRTERSSLLASWLRLSLATILNGRIMQYACNLLGQVVFAKPKIWLQKCSIITGHLIIFFFARGFAPRTLTLANSLM